MRLLIILLFLLLGSAQSLTEVLVGQPDRPQGAVVLVIDGMGSSYVYPEYGTQARALDGGVLGKAALFSLAGGARVLDVRVPVPGAGHNVLVTGCPWADEPLEGTTVFDLAREKNVTCVALLQKGSLPLALEQDAFLLFGEGVAVALDAEPVVGTRAGLSPDLVSRLQGWRDQFPAYAAGCGIDGCIGSNTWGLDAAVDLVMTLDPPFVLLVDLGGVEDAGRLLGPEAYLEAIASLDEPLARLVQACEGQDLLLLVTADGGMTFSDRGQIDPGRMESLRVPVVFMGPGVDDLLLTGAWSQADIAPTVVEMLGLDGSLSRSEGAVMPVRKRYDLEVRGIDPADVVRVRRDGGLVAEVAGDSGYIFRGMDRGAYTVGVGRRSVPVCLNGDGLLDLATTGRTPGVVVAWPALPHVERRTLLGAILILMINLAGVAMIVRIVRGG